MIKKTLCVTLAVMAGVAFVATANAWQQQAPAGNNAGLQVGTFDSRAVAIAYYRSAPFLDQTKSMFQELKAAKESSDQEKIAELEKKGPELQHLMHKQAFGTFPVESLLGGHKSEIARIAKEAKVDLIVSKWSFAFRSESAQTIDLTDQLVRLFDPSKETLDTIEAIRTKQPERLEDLKD